MNSLTESKGHQTQVQAILLGMVVEATSPAQQEIGGRPKRERKQVQRIRSSELRAANNRACRAKGTDQRTCQPNNSERSSTVSERVSDDDEDDDDEHVIIISLSKASESVHVDPSLRLNRAACEAYARGVGGGVSTLWNIVGCQVCGSAEELEHMILCDECDGGTCHLCSTASCTPAFFLNSLPCLQNELCCCAYCVFMSSLR